MYAFPCKQSSQLHDKIEQEHHEGILFEIFDITWVQLGDPKEGKNPGRWERCGWKHQACAVATGEVNQCTQSIRKSIAQTYSTATVAALDRRICGILTRYKINPPLAYLIVVIRASFDPTRWISPLQSKIASTNILCPRLMLPIICLSLQLWQLVCLNPGVYTGWCTFSSPRLSKLIAL